jgi:hypothetical protein
MTGAGSGNLAFGAEDSFLGSVSGGPDYFEPGHDPVITELTLDRAVSRQRMPGNVWSAESVAGNMEGAFGVAWTMDPDRQADVHDAIFNAASPYTLTSGLAQTSRWFVGLDYVSGGSVTTAERVLKGCAPLDYSIVYQQGGDLRCEMTFAYADEETNTSLTPTGVTEATGAPARWHGLDLTVDGTTQTKEQSATLTISNMSRFERGSQHLPVDAVVGAATATLDLTAIFTETDQQELAYGGATQTATTATLDSVAGEMVLSAGGSSFATCTLAELTPQSHTWADVIAGDTSATEQVAFNVDGDPAVSIA